MRAGFYSTVQENGHLSLVFATGNREEPLVIISGKLLEDAFVPPRRNEPLCLKPQAFAKKALNDKGISESEMKKAFAAMKDPKATRKKAQIPDPQACCLKFSQAAQLSKTPVPTRIGQAPKP